MKTCLWKRFDRIVVFDTETTGIDFVRDEIIELGAVSLEAGEERKSMDCLIRLSPGRTLPPFITDLTGITPEQLEALAARAGTIPYELLCLITARVPRIQAGSARI